MAIESGRPFFIQEHNTDTALPLDLSDEWLGRFAGRTDTTKALEGEIEIELSEKHTTTIPYLVAMIRYSRVVGKAWELIYGVKATSNQPVSHMIDYADTVLSNLLETLPEELTYDPDLPKAQFDTRKRWQIKQTMLLSTVSLCSIKLDLVQMINISPFLSVSPFYVFLFEGPSHKAREPRISRTTTS